MAPTGLWGPKCFLWLIPAVMITAGCRSQYVLQKTTDELIALVGDNRLSDRRRLSVFDEVVSRPLNQSQQQNFGRQLYQVIRWPRHSSNIRRRAIPLITLRYQDEAAEWLGEALVNSTEKDIFDEIVSSMIQLQDERALPYLIVALHQQADRSPFPSKPIRKTEEYIALERIAERPLDEILVEQLVNGDIYQTRLAALFVLTQLLGRQKTVALILNLKEADEFVNMVRFWAKRFGYLPTNFGRFSICQMQLATLPESSWDQLQQRAGFLSSRHNYQFDVRDSYLLLEMDQTDLTQAQSQRTEEISRRLAPLEHVKRPAAYPDAPDDYREDFVGRSSLFSYTDLLRIELILETLAQPDVIRRLRRFLRDDLADVQSEVAGLCFLDEARSVIFCPFAPQRRLGDNLYIESDDMKRQAGLCLARWHCHANIERTKELAGPGADDLQYAAYYNCPMVIITYINDKVLNVDYCTPEGVVVDLGNY